jgi:hypothetical protein
LLRALIALRGTLPLLLGAELQAVGRQEGGEALVEGELHGALADRVIGGLGGPRSQREEKRNERNERG